MRIFRKIFWCCFESQVFEKEELVRLLPEGVNKDSHGRIKTEAACEPLIHILGPLSAHLNLAKLPSSLPLESKIIKKISIGESHIVLLLANGQILVSGTNKYGQLGLKWDELRLSEEFTPLRLSIFDSQGFTPIDIACGSFHTIVLGESASGEQCLVTFGHEAGLGVKDKSHTFEPQQVTIKKLENPIKFLYASYMRSCVIDTKGNMFIWGEDFRGLRQREPKLFYSFLQEITQVSFGVKHGLALTKDGKVFAWGDGTYGELGSEGRMIQVPTEIPYFADNDILIKEIATGARHSLVLDYSGKMYAFGDNSEDQCAANEQRCEVPQVIKQNLKTLSIYSGKSHNAAVSNDGHVYTWGGAGSAYMKNPYTQEPQLRVVESVKGKTIHKVGMGSENTIIITGGYDDAMVKVVPLLRRDTNSSSNLLEKEPSTNTNLLRSQQSISISP